MFQNVVSPWHAILTGCQVVADAGRALSAMLVDYNWSSEKMKNFIKLEHSIKVYQSPFPWR